MVYRKTIQYSSVIQSLILFTSISAVLMITIGIIIGISTKSLINKDSEEIAETEEIPTSAPSTPTHPKQPRINFQTTIDEWISTLSGTASVVIFDVENNRYVTKYKPNEIYDTASLYKLFVVYEGYRRLDNSTWQADSAAGNTGHSILECLDLAIRESSSECGEALLNEIGVENMNQIIANEYGITNTNISDYTSNPLAIAEMMKLFYNHPDIKDEANLAQIKDSFVNQPATTYNWRQGLPSGFNTATVYDKVGWDYNPAGFWNVYHDAAIVEYPEQNRHFIVVVMTSLVPFEKIKELGTSIEETFLSTY